MAKTLRDSFWIWGSPAGSLEHSKNNEWKLPGNSRMTPAESAFYMGIPNLMMVRFGNEPRPPFRQYALPMRPLKRLVWSIIGDTSSVENDRKPDVEDVLALARGFPNLTGAMMDDFFRNDPAAPGRYTAAQLETFHQQLRTASRPLDLYVVFYDHQLGLPVKPHFDAVDVITYWTWQAKNLPALETNFAKLENLAPGKRKVLGIYMWDLGGSAPLPMDLMKYQCRLGLDWLKSGRVEGLIFLNNCFVDLDLETVEYARQFIAEVGEQPC